VASHTQDGRIPRVVHRRHRHHVYIGRGSKWGNPFKIGREGDRAEVIAIYERHVRDERSDLLAALHGMVSAAAARRCSATATSSRDGG
jgi:hypothetical protein